MLRRAEGVEVYHQRDLWGLLVGGRYRLSLHVGHSAHLIPGPRISTSEFEALVARSDQGPVSFGYRVVKDRTYWRFRGQWFWDNDGLTAADVYALLHTREQRQRDTLNRAHTMVAAAKRPIPAQRGRVRDDVKQLVWQRDGGRCRSCDSASELQYDHIIPVSMGGASTEDNLQILCGPCNRRKGASVV